MSAARAAHGDGTTLASTIVAGTPGRGGYRRLERAPGEQHLVRSELGGASLEQLRLLCCFVQLSDIHITDVQSPARAEFLDRLGDEDSPLAGRVGRVGVYRAQETLTLQVAESMARAVRRLQGAPFTGGPVDFAVTTGDSADNGQQNETENYVALLNGGRQLSSDSGDAGAFEGVGSAAFYDRRYWHPDGTPPGESDDIPRSRRGFPLVPGLLDASRAAFQATGLGIPWYAVDGNHDALFGGTLPQLPGLSALATGDLKPTGLPPDFDPLPLLVDNERRPSPGLWGLIGSPTRPVAADGRRRPVDRREWIAAHWDIGRSIGHGYDESAVSSGRTYYAFDRDVVRFLVLDTVNPAGGWQGSLDTEQFEWLERELVAGHSRYAAHEGRTVGQDVEDRIFVLLSHHPLECLFNDYAPDGMRRVLREEVAALLARFPNVIAWVNGHTHTNTVRPVPPGGPSLGGGYWQMTAASHIDWPQQARILEIAVSEATGDLVLISSMLDHLGLLDPRAGGLDDPLVLAGWSRELSVNAWQGRIGGVPIGRGDRLDRNVVCTIPAPFKVGP